MSIDFKKIDVLAIFSINLPILNQDKVIKLPMESILNADWCNYTL